MDKIKMTLNDMMTREGLLDELMDHVFDVSILVDSGARIIHISGKSFRDQVRPRRSHRQRYFRAGYRIPPFIRYLRQEFPPQDFYLKSTAETAFPVFFPSSTETELSEPSVPSFSAI